MSSPKSAASSSAITRQHTPADGSANGSDADEEGVEDQLPEKLKFLLAQSTIYSSIIAQKLAKDTEERQKKDTRATRRKELKEERAKTATQPTKTRETRRGAAQASNKPSAPACNGRKKQAEDSSDEEVVVTSKRSREASILSSQSESGNENGVKARDFEAAADTKASTSRSSKRQSQQQNGKKKTNGTNGRKSAAKSTASGSDSSDDAADAGQNGKDGSDDDEAVAKTAPLPDASEDVDRSQQPKLVTGAAMKSYQVAGMNWLISLYENGLNGILADEMGLGKTLQTIAFLAHLREQGVWGPFLVCCPLSTLANWVNEFERFTPDIPVVLYHGTPQERADLRETRLQPPTNEKPSDVKTAGKGKKGRGSASRAHQNTTDTFPIVVTSYELVMNDRKFLGQYKWKYLVVDESHRIKNLNCKLIKELMSYNSANRILLTGTPLQNNLEELWSLLNFLMPDIFDDLDSFKSWFDIDLSADDSASYQIITKLHSILKPFLLRRVKRDVAKSLPPKKEYLLSAPLTQQQKKLYDAVIKRQIRDFLLSRRDLVPNNGKAAFSSDDEDVSPKKGKAASKGTPQKGTKRKSEASESASASKRQRSAGYKEESDEDWLDALDDGTARERAEDFEQRRWGKSRLNMVRTAQSDDEDSKQDFDKNARDKIKGLKLSNMVMQLRKVVNHPWLFDWPNDPKTGEYVLDDRVVSSSGKMMLLDRLLARLFAEDHKVLVYSQFTTQLDIIEDWAVEWKGWNICRIDGRTPQEDRRRQLKSFNDKKSKNAPRLFLLSTRSGGVGINLTGADTVVLFDSDWNPQMDLQAMDRVHRLGQTKPVLIFRLVTANTIEAKMLERAGNKRKLEALVIGSGKYTASLEDLQDIFSGNTSKGSGDKAAGLAAQMFAAEMQDQASRDRGEGDASKDIRVIQEGDEVISDKQLDLLLDRSDEAMQRGKGWKASDGKKAAKAFEVIETVTADQGDEDELADLFKHESRAASPGTEDE